jgi:adenine-specific DNA-methyltransferase
MPVVFTKSQLGEERVNGFYETPYDTVKYMCREVLKRYKPGMRILDPAVGDGVFLHYLRDSGVSPGDLYGYDIDLDKISLLSKTFPNVTIFDSTNPLDSQFDFIVGNPPYNGDDSHWVRDNRDRLHIVAKEIGAKNTYSIITYQSVRALRPDGYISIILSDSFLTNIYYKPFREYLLANLKIDELLLAPRRLFHGASADVRTCIIRGSKQLMPLPIIDDNLPLFSNQNSSDQPDHDVRLVDRLNSEFEYDNPPKVELVGQKSFVAYPDSTFLIGVPSGIRKLYLNPEQRLGDIALGGTGISTGKDKIFLRKAEEVKDNPDWVPYYKNGARQPYWYKPDYYIERDYQKNADSSPTFMLRNKKYFFKEGITCSSVGVRFSAAYLPAGCLFGVNANFFFKNRDELFFILGLLNTKISWYFARMVLVRTNNISANYLRKMPICVCPPEQMKEIAKTVNNIRLALQSDPSHDYSKEQFLIEKAFSELYKLDNESLSAIDEFCKNFYEKL